MIIPFPKLKAVCIECGKVREVPKLGRCPCGGKQVKAFDPRRLKA